MAFDLVKFNSYVYTAMTETVDQQVQAFNSASNNALMLAPSDSNVGDFALQASFKLISGLVRRRDVNNGTDPVTATRLQQLKAASVKVAAGTPPINFEPAQYRWILENPELAGVVIGEQLAAAMVQDQLNTAVRGLVAALSGNADVVSDITSATVKTPSISSMTAAAAKFGDRSSSIAAWILHSKTMNDIWQDALKNGSQLFRFGDVAVMQDQFGRRFIMTDSPALMVPATTGSSATPAYYYTLGLVPQAALVEPNNDFDATMVDGTGHQNIQRTYQAEWSYNLGLLGYTWNTSDGGSSPTDAALGTSTNWDKVVTSNKDTAGVLLKSE